MMPTEQFNHLRITYLIKGRCQAYALEAEVKVVAQDGARMTISSLRSEGFWPDMDTYIPGSAIIEIAKCNAKGYTRRFLEQVERSRR